jgi:hypothetical protein
MQREIVKYLPKGNTERGYDHVLSGIIIFCFAFAVLAVGMNRDVNLYDEGSIATGASRVATGAIPHRDLDIPFGQHCYLAS